MDIYNICIKMMAAFDITFDECIEIMRNGFAYKHKGNIPSEIESKIKEAEDKNASEAIEQ